MSGDLNLDLPGLTPKTTLAMQKSLSWVASHEDWMPPLGFGWRLSSECQMLGSGNRIQQQLQNSSGVGKLLELPNPVEGSMRLSASPHPRMVLWKLTSSPSTLAMSRSWGSGHCLPLSLKGSEHFLGRGVTMSQFEKLRDYRYLVVLCAQRHLVGHNELEKVVQMGSWPDSASLT